MKQDRHVFFATDFCRLFIGLDEGRVIPALDDLDVKRRQPGLTLEAIHDLGDGLFGRLVAGRDRDAVFVIPHRHQQGNLQNSSRIHGFPEQAFAGACVADRAKGNFIAVDRKFYVAAKVRIFAVDF